MQAYIFLFLSVTSAVDGFVSDWLPDANNLGEYDPSNYITPQSNLFEDPVIFTDENQAISSEDQIPFDPSSLNPPWGLFADTSGDCSDIFLNKNRLKKRQGAVCAAAKRNTRNSRLGVPTLQDIEAQERAGAAAESNQPQCPPKDHPNAVEAVCSSGDANDEGNSAVYPGALILANCERRTSSFYFPLSFTTFWPAAFWSLYCTFPAKLRETLREEGKSLRLTDANSLTQSQFSIFHPVSA